MAIIEAIKKTTLVKSATFTAPLEQLHSNVYQHHVKVPEAIAAAFINDNHKRVVAQFNDLVTKHCSIMPGGGFSYLLLNAKEIKRLKVRAGDQIAVVIRPDTSKYGMPMPEELEVVLAQEVAAKDYFERLTAGKQRSLIHLVNQVKNTQSRINKALAIAHHLKEMDGQIDFKKLNVTIQYYNQRGSV